jgi:hypothetical protein
MILIGALCALVVFCGAWSWNPADIVKARAAANSVANVATLQGQMITVTGQVAALNAGTNLWTQAAADGASWTNAKAAALKSVTNSWTDTNGIAWHVVIDGNGMIKQ